MKRILRPILVLVLVSLIAVGCGKSDDLTSRAEKLTEQLAAGDFNTPVESFDATMKASLPPGALKQAWESLVSQSGAFKRITGSRTAKAEGYDVVYVTCEFEKGSFDVKVVFDGNKQVAGLFFVPTGTG